MAGHSAKGMHKPPEDVPEYIMYTSGVCVNDDMRS